MKISIIGWHSFLKPIAKELEKKGCIIFFNRFSKDVDIILVQSNCHYKIYKYIKKIKKRKIKIVNIILDIPIFRLQKNFPENNFLRCIQQILHNFVNKKLFWYKIVYNLKFEEEKNIFHKYLSLIIKLLFKTRYINRIYYQINYRNYLKYADLNLSISKFTQKIVKRFLKVDTQVWYPGVDSQTLLNLPKPKEIKYDAINISKVLWWKRQEIFVKAAKKLNLKILIIGPYLDKNINLECPHYELNDHYLVFQKLNEAKFYVDASIFEGFGMTPIEAAYLNKITIASDTLIHREILGNYPLYFKKDDVDDLVEKMKMVIKGDFKLNPKSVKRIKENYSLDTSVKRLLEYLKSIV